MEMKDYLMKRYRRHQRILKSSKSTISESDYSRVAVEELRKILKHFKCEGI